MSEAFTWFIPGYRGSYSLYSHCVVAAKIRQTPYEGYPS
jgi:hypothetical protein